MGSSYTLNPRRGDAEKWRHGDAEKERRGDAGTRGCNLNDLIISLYTAGDRIESLVVSRFD